MADTISLEKVQVTFANWQSNRHEKVFYRTRFEMEAKMLTLELLSEINESLKKIALLGDCVTENNQLQTSTEVWNEQE